MSGPGTADARPGRGDALLLAAVALFVGLFAAGRILADRYGGAAGEAGCALGALAGILSGGAAAAILRRAFRAPARAFLLAFVGTVALKLAVFAGVAVFAWRSTGFAPVPALLALAASWAVCWVPSIPWIAGVPRASA